MKASSSTLCPSPSSPSLLYGVGSPRQFFPSSGRRGAGPPQACAGTGKSPITGNYHDVGVGGWALGGANSRNPLHFDGIEGRRNSVSDTLKYTYSVVYQLEDTLRTT